MADYIPTIPTIPGAPDCLGTPPVTPNNSLDRTGPAIVSPVPLPVDAQGAPGQQSWNGNPDNLVNGGPVGQKEIPDNYGGQTEGHTHG